MLTVDEVNKSFAEKGIFITLPLDPSFSVVGIRIMEKINLPAAVRILIKIEYINQHGKSVSELIHCEGPVRKEKKEVAVIIEPLKSSLLPTRSESTFTDEKEALDYLKVAITHLLVDKGYALVERDDCDLYFEKSSKNIMGFFINLAVRCDEKASERAKELIELRRQYGVYNDYALVVPAFQESLGLPLRLQERWIAQNQERLSMQNIGVYGVDLLDPNHLYAFTIYPRLRELKSFFMRTSQQWSLLRSRIVQERHKPTPEAGQPEPNA